MKNQNMNALGKRWLLFEYSMSGFLITAAAASVIGTSVAETNDAETKFISPIITEEALPDEPKELTLRLGTEYRERGSDADGSLPYVEACFGLIERFGATVNVPFAYHKEVTGEQYGLGDISARLKYLALRPISRAPAVVFAVQTVFPTGNHRLNLGDGAYELTPYAALLEQFGTLLVQGDIGWSKQVTGDRKAAWIYDWAASVPIYRRKLYLLTEINGDWGSPNHAAIAPGFKYLFSNRFSFGAVVPVGLNKHTEAWGIVTQFQYDF
jgi:Putative MetA-pathway of phenol degradation